MQQKIKYQLFSFLLLFAVSSIASIDCYAAPTKGSSHEISIPAKDNESNITFIDHVPGPSLCNIQEVQTLMSLGFKRIQGDKDMLLLHAHKADDKAKASSGDHIKFADNLTHISLSLFPYHFFW